MTIADHETFKLPIKIPHSAQFEAVYGEAMRLVRAKEQDGRIVMAKPRCCPELIEARQERARQDRDARKRVILAALCKGPATANVLSRRIRVSGSTVRGYLNMLEAEGKTSRTVERNVRVWSICEGSN